MLFRTWDQPRAEQAIAEVTDHVGVPHVVVTSPRLIKQVLTDPARFGPGNALDAITPMPVNVLRVLAAHRFRLPPTLANNGGFSHPGIRAITAEYLGADRVAAAEPWLTGLVRDRVEALTKRLNAGETVDLYADLAADLPLLVLARLVQLPDADTAVVKQFSRAALELFWAPVPGDRQARLARIVGRFHEVLRDFAATGGGLVGELRALTAAERLPADTPIGALFFLLVAGQETTSQFLTLLMHRLIGEPGVLDQIIDGTVEVADVVEEGLRLEPPIPTWRRMAQMDTTLDGVAIPKGRSVVLWLAQAGLAAAGDEFRPGQRGSRRHLAFGAGPHRCVGAPLSRMEAAVVIKATAPLLRVANVQRAPWYPDNLSFRMPDALLVARLTEGFPRTSTRVTVT